MIAVLGELSTCLARCQNPAATHRLPMTPDTNPPRSPSLVYFAVAQQVSGMGTYEQLGAIADSLGGLPF